MIDLGPFKAWCVKTFHPGHPCRELALAEPDLLDEQTFAVLAPRLLKLAGAKTEGSP